MLALPYEIWKDIPRYRGYYQISTMRNVRSVERCVTASNGKVYHLKSKIIFQRLNSDGYPCTSLCKNGKSHYEAIHVLMAETFIPNPNNYPEVNHKDEIKQNNTLTNLEWCTHKYNCNYGTINDRKRDKQINCHCNKHIIQMTLDGRVIREFPSISEVRRMLKFNPAHISECCNSKKKQYKGFKWMFK